MLTGQDPLRLLGSGEQVRHYTYGGDLARGIVTAMEHPGATRRGLQPVPARPTTVTELATLIWHKIKGPRARLRLVHDAPGPMCSARSPARPAAAGPSVHPVDQMLDEVIPWIAHAIETGMLLPGFCSGATVTYSG